MRETVKNKSHKYTIKSVIKNIMGYYDEDLEQEVYIRAWQKYKNYTEQNSLKQWLSTIASNICKDYLKSKQYKTSTMKTDDDSYLENIKEPSRPEMVLDSKIRQKIILKAIDRLPKKMKDTIVLYELEEKTYEEISQKLNIPIGTIKSRLFNARKILSEDLKELIGD